MTSIHSIIVREDETVVPIIEPMMGKEMIVYKAKGSMKYALSSVKNYMSLHVLPIYGSPALFTKYKALLPRANFQKGCINFTSAEEMPADTIKQLFADCSKIDLLKIREDYLREKKLKGKAKR
jgi:glycine/serine hydroxymethyltransferase